MVLVALLIVACSGNPEQASTLTTSHATTTAALQAVTSTTTLPTTSSTAQSASNTTTLSTLDPSTLNLGDLSGWDSVAISLGGETLRVAMADDQGERMQGLMGVDDLGDLDGMLFAFPTEELTGFWMKNTLIPLDIAFFSSDGSLVDHFQMEPCLTNQCPVYVASGPFSWALETPVGALGELNADSVLVVDPS